jgi:hypothetical protein
VSIRILLVHSCKINIEADFLVLPANPGFGLSWKLPGLIGRARYALELAELVTKTCSDTVHYIKSTVGVHTKLG